MKSSPYQYTDRQGKEIDLSAWLDDPEWTKARVASIARHKDRIHGLARALDALRNAGYTRNDTKQIVEWILSGKSLAGIS
jgi:hypothetical protein